MAVAGLDGTVQQERLESRLLVVRGSEEVLESGAVQDNRFIPWFPLAAGNLAALVWQARSGAPHAKRLSSCAPAEEQEREYAKGQTC